MRFVQVLFPSLLLVCGSWAVSGQEVVAAHSGIVHFSEGSVYVDDSPVDQRTAIFPEIKQGSTLRTEKGRAEVLLTPGVILRVDENSSIRMRSVSLADTRAEVVRGAAIVDSLGAPGDSRDTLIYRDSEVRFARQGVYRIDCEPGLLQVYSGRAEVSRAGKLTDVDESHFYSFALDGQVGKNGDGTDDEFYAWAKDRNQAISADDQLTAQGAADPDDVDGDVGDLAGSGLPDLGIPNYPLPRYSVPNYSAPGGLSPGTSLYAGSSALINPLSPLYVSPYVPYVPLPLLVLPRPYRYGASVSRYPYRPYYSGFRSGVTSGFRSGIPGVTTIPSRPIVIWPSRPVGVHTTPMHPVYAHPVVPRPAAPVVPHVSMGHR